MNWYLEQKEAWNWKAMLPGGGGKQPTPTPQSKPLEAPGRSRQDVERDIANVRMQMNALRGPQKNTPGAAQKLQQLQQQFQNLLNESSNLHEVSWPAGK